MFWPSAVRVTSTNSWVWRREASSDVTAGWNSFQRRQNSSSPLIYTGVQLVVIDLAFHLDQWATSKSQYKGTVAHNAPVLVVRRHMRKEVKGDEEGREHIRREAEGDEEGREHMRRKVKGY
jgi:hypothetical protein